MVCTFIDQYSKLLPFNGIELDHISVEFLDYQSMSKDVIPKDTWDEAICDEQHDGCNKVTYHRVDRIWSYLGEMKLNTAIDFKNCESGQCHFNHITFKSRRRMSVFCHSQDQKR